MNKLRTEVEALRDKSKYDKYWGRRVDLELINAEARSEHDTRWYEDCYEEADHYRKIWRYGPTEEDRKAGRVDKASKQESDSDGLDQQSEGREGSTATESTEDKLQYLNDLQTRFDARTGEFV